MTLSKIAGTALIAVGLTIAAILPATAGDYGKKKDIVDTAVADGRFTTLAAALEAADLIGALKGDGPFTVFAPTDDAFAALPAGTVENLLLPENKDQLVAVLTYHVLSGKTKSSALAGKTLTVETLNGATVAIDGTDGVKVNDATVIVADVKAKNGIIHAINAVLLPPVAE